MNVEDFIQMVINDPVVFALKMEPDIKEKQARLYLDIVLKQAALDYPYDFAMDTADLTTVVDTAEYTCKGNNSDCRQVYNVRYSVDGEYYYLLTKREKEDLDRYQSENGMVSDVLYWSPGTPDDKFPVIVVTDAPDTAGYTLRYRYWRNNLEFGEWPQDFLFVLRDGIVANFNKDFIGQYERSRQEMVEKYEITGGEDNPAPLDPVLRAMNRRRESHIGY